MVYLAFFLLQVRLDSNKRMLEGMLLCTQAQVTEQDMMMRCLSLCELQVGIVIC